MQDQFAMTRGAFPASLIATESGGNWGALNAVPGAGGFSGHGGRLQFGTARLADAARAGVIPAGMTAQEFAKQPPEVQMAVENWHFADIDNYIRRSGLDRAIGTTIGGAPVTLDGMRAVAHLGGVGGLQKFVSSQGQYNPSDVFGTSLLDYLKAHSGASASQPAPSGLMLSDRISTQGAPMAGLMDFAPEPEPQNWRERIAQSWQSGELPDRLTLALNSLRMRPDQGLAQAVMARQEQRSQERQANRTAEWLASMGRTDLAQAIATGALDARSAAVIAMTPQAAPEQTSAIQNYEFLRAQGVDDQTAMERSFGAGGTTVQNIMPGAPSIGAIPPGFQAIQKEDGSWVMSPIPGSPAEQESLAQEEKATARRAVEVTKGDIVIEDIDRIFDIAGTAQFPVTGVMGAMLQTVPGTAARDVKGLLGGIKSNIAFSQLQTMRDNSPTGGALGTVSNMETQKLEAVYGELEQSQSQDQFLYNLQRLQKIYTDIVHGPGIYEQRQAELEALRTTKPASVPPRVWAAMTDEERQQAISLAGGVR
jgi:hypothetical protein